MSHPAPSLRWRVLVVVVAAPLGGCTDPAKGGDTSPPAAEDTASMVYSTDDPEPLWSVQDFQEVLASVLGRGTPSPAIISDAYVQIMAEGDEDCPGDATQMQTAPEGCASRRPPTPSSRSPLSWTLTPRSSISAPPIRRSS